MLEQLPGDSGGVRQSHAKKRAKVQLRCTRQKKNWEGGLIGVSAGGSGEKKPNNVKPATREINTEGEVEGRGQEAQVSSRVPVFFRGVILGSAQRRTAT